jgi:hypothetical protein
VVVEARDLENLDHGQPHLGRERHDHCLGQAVVGVVDGVQVFNQQVAPVAVGGRCADQCTHRLDGGGGGLAALEVGTRSFARTGTVSARRRDGGDGDGAEGGLTHPRTVSAGRPPVKLLCHMGSFKT